jgi:dienelactone hydrolase
VDGYIARQDNSTGQGRIIIAIRGTANLDNVAVDLQKSLTSEGLVPGCPTCRVHAGFYLAFKAIAEIIEGDVTDQLAKYPSYQLVITGHSLGGALAAMLVFPLFRD